MRLIVKSPIHRSRGARDENGVVAIMVALSLTALLIGAAMILDFGLVRVDRQVNRAAADASVAAGLHNLGGNGGKAYPYRGVCSALEYLQQNDRRFAATTASSGAWSDGNDLATGNGCTNTALRDQSCVAGSKATWAKYVATTTWQGEPIRVTIQSGYQLNVSSSWSEDTLAAVAADSDDQVQGCYQLAVIITQNRDPGLGSLATTSDLVSSIRSVGRVMPGEGKDAPALLLLKRTGCPILTTGGSGGGSHIWVAGAISSDGKTQPGTVHADTSGTGCSGGSNQNIFLGRASNGIVAYAAPLATNTALPDPTKPGQITSTAVESGISPTSGVVRDLDANVYGSAALNAAGAAAAGKSKVLPRSLVTRKPVDDRYLTGVTNAINGAQASVFGSSVFASAASATAAGWTVVTGPNACNPATIPAGTQLFIDCTDNNGYKGTPTINAETVVFKGRVNPSATVSLPNAKKVYIFGLTGKPAIELGTGAGLSVHTAGNLNAAGTACAETVSSVSTNKTVVFVKSGEIKQTGGLLRMCRTTMFMLGGEANGCLPPLTYLSPATTDWPPDATPCGSSSTLMGTGQLTQTGGDVDWTAPNEHDVMTDQDGRPLAFSIGAWNDVNGPEDLAFWSESGTSSSITYNITGGGQLHTVGVYMVPNADPFIIGGGANQVLTNAQYIATAIELNGNNTAILMSVDPNAAVTVPRLRVLGLVR